MPAKKKPRDFESSLARLEEITQGLESGELSLDESIDLYSEGLALARDCQKKLTAAQEKIKLIAKKNEVVVEEDFGGEDA
ncbi:MAG: exodeoxyribonuclease VII small subunit [bacterium]